MKILILNYEFPPVGGGGSPVTYEMAKYLVKLGNDVDVVTMGFKGLPAYEVSEGINIYRVKSIRKRKDMCKTHEMIFFVFAAIFFLKKFLKNKKYDICHCHFIVPTGLVALWVKKKFKLDYVLTVHGSDVPGYNSDRFQFEHNFTKPLLKKVCKNAKIICSPSKYLKNLLLKNIGHYEIEHIPNGIDLENFKLDLTKNKKDYILSTGRLFKRKGFQTLIKAVYDIKLPFEVHIVGDGYYREYLQDLAKGSKTKIIFHGWLEKGSKELLKLYEEAKIYVLASSKENASISLLEGMAAKTTVITTNVSGCPETVEDAGYLIDVDDYLSLRKILLALSNNRDLIKEYSRKSYQRLLDNFLWDDIIKNYIALFKK